MHFILFVRLRRFVRVSVIMRFERVQIQVSKRSLSPIDGDGRCSSPSSNARQGGRGRFALVAPELSRAHSTCHRPQFTATNTDYGLDCKFA